MVCPHYSWSGGTKRLPFIRLKIIYRAERHRIEPLGGHGQRTLILGLDDRQGTMRQGQARRVGSNELLGGLIEAGWCQYLKTSGR